MARKVDITDKLTFEENPKLIIKGKEFEVNTSAATMLLIMGDFANKKSMQASLSAYERMFSDKDRKEITKMGLSFRDLMTVIEAAMDLIQGTMEPGEAQTHTTT